MTTTDARKRNRDMADAHETARARDERGESFNDFLARVYRWTPPLAASVTYPPRTHAINPTTGEFTRLDQESDMTDELAMRDRHFELVALLTEIRDRLPGRVEARVAPFDPDVIAANLEAIKHEAETPMRGHGECCEPVDIIEEPPVGSRLVDCHGHVWRRGERGWGIEGLIPGSNFDNPWSTVQQYAPLRFTIDEDRKRVGLPLRGEPAPADVDLSEERLAKAIGALDAPPVIDWEGLMEEDREVYRDMARAAREHIEQEIPEELDKIGITWQSRARRMGKRAEKAEAERDEWKARHAALRADVDEFQYKHREYPSTWELVDALGRDGMRGQA